MYAVVGCGECSALWVVEGNPERTECPRCGTSRTHDLRREFLTTEDEDHAREVRASMLASRQGESDAFAEVPSFGELEGEVEEAGVDDETYLERSGVDTEVVAAAAERAESGAGGGQSADAVVRAAVREQDRPDRAAVLAYAAERGVEEATAERLLEKLVRAGEATRSGGGYRLL